MLVKKYEDLEGGTVLRLIVSMFNEDKTGENYRDVLYCLRDSFVFIPCTMQMNEIDTKKPTNNDKEGTAATGDKLLYNKPAIIKKGTERWLPIFSSKDQLSEEDNNKFLIKEIPFLDAILLTELDEEIAGIVLDPFSLSFTMSRQTFDLIKRIPIRENR